MTRPLSEVKEDRGAAPSQPSPGSPCEGKADGWTGVNLELFPVSWEHWVLLFVPLHLGPSALRLPELQGSSACGDVPTGLCPGGAAGAPISSHRCSCVSLSPPIALAAPRAEIPALGPLLGQAGTGTSSFHPSVGLQHRTQGSSEWGSGGLQPVSCPAARVSKHTADEGCCSEAEHGSREGTSIPTP